MTTKKSNWEEDLDVGFPNLCLIEYTDGRKKRIEPMFSELKFFIRQLIEKTRKETLKQETLKLTKLKLMKKETFIKFLKDQKKKHYSAECILDHLKNGWEEIDDEIEIPITGILDTKNKRIIDLS